MIIHFSTILTSILHGLILGMVLVIVAGGLTIIFGMLDVLNFAHGSLNMLGGHLGYTLGALLFFILEETLNPSAPGAHLLFLGSILIAIMFLLPNGLLSLVYKTGTLKGPLAIRIVRKERKEGLSPRVV